MKTLEESIAQKEATLREKDADLRESILSVQTMQRDHREEVTRERDKNQKLDEEAQKLRAQARASCVISPTPPRLRARTRGGRTSR